MTFYGKIPQAIPILYLEFPGHWVGYRWISNLNPCIKFYRNIPQAILILYLEFPRHWVWYRWISNLNTQDEHDMLFCSIENVSCSLSVNVLCSCFTIIEHFTLLTYCPMYNRTRSSIHQYEHDTFSTEQVLLYWERFLFTVHFQEILAVGPRGLYLHEHVGDILGKGPSPWGVNIRQNYNTYFYQILFVSKWFLNLLSTL